MHGVTSTVDASLIREMAASMLRVDALAVVMALLGFALATIGRNTAVALGVGFVYLAVVETIIRGFKPAWSDWLLGDNIGLFLFGVEESPLSHGQGTAALILVAYIGTLVVLAHDGVPAPGDGLGGFGQARERGLRARLVI